MKMLKVICTLFIFGFVSVSHAGVIFITEKDANGTVTSWLGADNVDVNGVLYNVRFLDGSCFRLFSGCDETFTPSNSILPADLSDFSDIEFLLILAAYGGGGSSAPDNNFNIDVLQYCQDDIYLCQILLSSSRNDYRRDLSLSSFQMSREGDNSRDWDDFVHEFSITGIQVNAIWSEAVEVSAPGTAMVLLMGIAGLIVSQRRKQA